MTTLSTLPQVVDIDHYAGDTLPIHIAISDVLIGGRVFSAQVRKTKNSQKIDGTFTVTIIAGVGADIFLPSATCLELTKRGDYEGFWDVQLAPAAGGDPVTTLAAGALRLHSDVTRSAP
ncbi:MAG: hypothetical protein ACOYB3_04970 [Azonexus sp.]